LYERWLQRLKYGQLVFRLLDAAETRYLLGYVLAGIFLAGWFVHSKYLRREITREMDRISGERSPTAKPTRRTIGVAPGASRASV
jgi:hypothetical protein